MSKFRKLAILTLLSLLIFFNSPKVKAQTVEELNKKIQEYTDQINRLQGEASTLSNQIKEFDAKINLTTTKILQTQEQIKLLRGRIDQLEVSLGSLTDAFNSRVSETYKMSRVDASGNPMLLITSKNISDAVSVYHYLQKIQEADRQLIERLESAKSTYNDQKLEFEDLEKVLNAQKSELDSQKAAKASLLSATKNDERKYQDLLSEAKKQLSALRRFVSSQGGASILSNQTKCDGWGCYYNQRDSLWGNIGLGGSNYSVAEYGCLISSISMVASHKGVNLKPDNIALSTSAFVPSTGYLYHSFSANGVNVTVTTASKSQLDSELAAGRPVIAGLYSGPDHFIVILRKEGSGYIMHDPFLENGANRPLTDKYNVSDITSLRLVSFN